MLLSQMPGYLDPTVAIFPFPWFESPGRWTMMALKVQADKSVKWKRHFVDSGNGHAIADVYDNFEKARTVACEFNVGLEDRIRVVLQTPEQRQSVLLKAEKEITSQQRLAHEEQLMLLESMRRSRLLPKPRIEDLKVPNWSADLLEELYQQLSDFPKSSIVQIKMCRATLIKKGESDWSFSIQTNQTTAKYCYRDKIASGFGLSGREHWGKTKSKIRTMLLPRANELLQLASVKRILADALAKGQRVVVAGGFVFWYESPDAGWIMKAVGGESESSAGNSIWNEGTIISKNHGRIVVLPYIKENGDKVQGHTKNVAHDGKALPRHPDEYLELPFKVLEGDLMIGLFGELHHD